MVRSIIFIMNFYEKMGVPAPKLGPKERLQRRLAFRNERKLHVRKCDSSGNTIVSNLRPDAPFPVMHVEEWHKQAYEVPFVSWDPNRPFFEQFREIWNGTPRMHKATAGNEDNSEYSNHCGNCRNCYFIFNSEEDEDCMYIRFGDKSRDCVDCTNIIRSELCYECVNVKNCYNLRFSDDCDNCSDSTFLRNCRGVRNSMFCYGLERVEYCFFNEQLTKEEYERRVAEYDLASYAGLYAARQAWDQFAAQWPLMRHVILNSENCEGESIFNSQNCSDCYNISDCQDCKYVLNCVDVKDSQDVYAYGMETALAYECVTLAYAYDVKFCVYAVKSNSLEYCMNMWNCQDCFGCIGLRDKQYCILNKQYTKEEYEALLPQIKAAMLATGEYGEFFPVEFSDYPYEDTMAQDYFPQPVSGVNSGEGRPTLELPDHLRECGIEISNEVYLCPIEQKSFKFQAGELKFYKKMGVALPRMSFEARYKYRNRLVPFPY